MSSFRNIFVKKC